MTGDAAVKMARQRISDDDACERLQRELNRYSGETKREALGRLSQEDASAEFIRDRAYRLLEAVVTSQRVRSVDERRANLFKREEELGHKTLADAYDALVLLEPALEELRGEIGSAVADARTIRRRAKVLVGPRAKNADELVRSQLALGITYKYLYARAGDTELGDLMTSYFASPNRAGGTLLQKGLQREE